MIILSVNIDDFLKAMFLFTSASHGLKAMFLSTSSSHGPGTWIDCDMWPDKKSIGTKCYLASIPQYL